jgi:hypothetical protein
VSDIERSDLRVVGHGAWTVAAGRNKFIAKTCQHKEPPDTTVLLGFSGAVAEVRALRISEGSA